MKSCMRHQSTSPASVRLQLSSLMFAACGLWLLALGVYFVALRPALLPEDPRFMGSSLETLRAAAPGIDRWLGHVFNVMGGFMIATGALTLLLARRYLAVRAGGTLTAMTSAGVASVALMSVTNFALASDFRWLLLVPALLWFAALGCYVREGRHIGVLEGVGRWQGQRRFFRDQAFHFQTLRTLNNVRADGAEFGEVLHTVGQIREGDTASWYAGWEATASRILERASRIGDAQSRGQALLRAHNYLRTAEFFLAPSDPKRPVTFRRNVEAFEAGLDALKIQRERSRVPFGPNHLNAIFYPPPAGADPRPLLVFCGGFDSTLEELYFAIVPAAHSRGFGVLTFEGPGQGAVLREQGLPFRPDWEVPTTAVLDAHFDAHPRKGKTIMVGMSMGGYLAPRAAAFDRRIDGVVAFDVLFDFGAVARSTVPAFALWLRARHWDALLNLLIATKARLSPGIAWSVANGQWVLGTASAMETLDVLAAYTLGPVAGRIEADVLILAGAEDQFIPARQAADFAAALTAARCVTTVVYDRASGGAEHCQMGAQALWHADLFDWISGID
jgi:alpha-beta hydrolase superfamily lysophospholipase